MYNSILNNGVLAQSDIWNNLESCWRFNETTGTAVSDATPNARNATVYGTYSWTTGIKNNALSLSNADLPYVLLPTGSTYNNWERTDTWSFNLWFKRLAINFNSLILYSKSKQTLPLAGWRFAILDRNTLQLAMINDWVANNKIVIENATTFTSTTNWYNVGFTYNGTSKASGCTLYINGAKNNFSTITNDTLTASIKTNSTCLIGRMEGLTYNPQAIFDEYRIWSRLLSASDMTNLYNAGAGIFY